MPNETAGHAPGAPRPRARQRRQPVGVDDLGHPRRSLIFRDGSPSVLGHEPDQRPDPRVHRADQAPRTGRIDGPRPAARGERRRRPPRHDLAPEAAPDQPAPERPLGLPDRRAQPVHPRPGRDARGRPVGPQPLSQPGADPGRARRVRPVRRPGRRDPSDGGAAPRRRPRTVRPLLRRARPERVRRPGRCPPAGLETAQPRGPQPADHRTRAGALDPRPAPGAGRGRRARRLCPGRGDRAALAGLPGLEAGPR